MESIIAYVSANYPTLFLIGIIFVLAFFAAKYHLRIQGTHTKCDRLVDVELPAINTKLDNLATTVNKIATYLVASGKNVSPILFVSNSPLELTPLGIQILEESGGKKWIDENINELLTMMKQQGFKSGLDVQNYSTSVLVDLSSRDSFLHIKNFLFQNPIYKSPGIPEVTLDLPTCFNIMGIYLRNKYFDLYPDLKKDFDPS